MLNKLKSKLIGVYSFIHKMMIIRDIHNVLQNHVHLKLRKRKNVHNPLIFANKSQDNLNFHQSKEKSSLKNKITKNTL